MSLVARYAKVSARAGQGDAVAELLLEAADANRQAPGCELYVVNRVTGDPDTIWVTELWASEEAMNDALARAAADGSGLIGRVMELVDGWDRVDLEPAGGAGLAERPRPGWQKVALDEVEDLAPKSGLGEIQQMRSLVAALGLERTGITLQRILPGQRQPFGHAHANAEETYVVLAGSGTLRLPDEEVPLRAREAVRIAPDLTRAVEAGPDGIEYLAVGPRLRGDVAMTPGWWGAGASTA
jgi:uncharacterized cupin superfamily protein/quinol monooxygenase YgiN